MYRHYRHSKNQKPSTTQYYHRDFDNRGVRRERLVYFFQDDEEDKVNYMDRHSNKDSLGLTATTNTLLHHDTRDDHDHEDDDDNNSVSLFQVEESSLIHVQLLDRPRSLALAQYNTLHQEWGIYSTIWDGGIGLLKYVCDLHASSHDDHLHHVSQGIIHNHGSSGGGGGGESSSSDSSLLSASSSDWNSTRNADKNVLLSSWRDLTVIDIGSGTGLVGLGIAAASKGKALVAVTDLPLAMPLLKENAQLNHGHWTLGRQVQTPECHVLKWGQECNDDFDDSEEKEHDIDDKGGQDSDDYFPNKWLEQFLQRGEATSPSSPPPPPTSSSLCTTTETTATTTTSRRQQTSKTNKKKNRRRFLITGADVIYRKSLFEPLLITLTALWTKLGHYASRRSNHGKSSNNNNNNNKSLPQVDCLLACQSIRGHLDEFWTMARNHGFDVQRIALVDLDTTSSPHAKLDLAAAVITHLHDNEDGRRLPPVTHTEKREGRIWIIRLEKLPYTFDI